jgi:hypothetical protein
MMHRIAIPLANGYGEFTQFEATIERSEDFARGQHVYRAVGTSPFSGQRVGTVVIATREMLDDSKFDVDSYISGAMMDRLKDLLEGEKEAMEVYEEACAEHDTYHPSWTNPSVHPSWSSWSTSFGQLSQAAAGASLSVNEFRQVMKGVWGA